MISSPPIKSISTTRTPILAWPQELIYDSNGSVCGFLMPLVEPTWSINNLFFPERRGKLRTDANASIGWHNLHEIARNLAIVVDACHKSGYVIGDLNNSNVRVYPDGQVCLIDTDSFQVVDRSQHPPIVHHCEVVFLDYASPELLGTDLSQFDRKPENDCHALATLIFMLLQDGVHPFAAMTSTDPPRDPVQLMQARCFPYDSSRNDQSVKPYPTAPSFGRLHSRLRELFVQAFTEGLDNPQRRPSAETWHKALGGARADLRKCARGHYYVATRTSRCLQVVGALGGGYCGSTVQSRSQSPLAFSQIDPIIGERSSVRAATRISVGGSARATNSSPSTGTPAPPPTPPSPAASPSFVGGSTGSTNPPPSTGTPRPVTIPPSPVVSSPAAGSKPTKFQLLGVGLGIALVLAFAATRLDTDSPTMSTSQLRSPTPAFSRAPSRPTRTPAPAPSPKVTQASAASQVKPQQTTIPIKPTATATETEVPVPPSPSPPVAANGTDATPKLQISSALIFSLLEGDSWSLRIYLLISGEDITLLDSSPIDPAPTLSFDSRELAYLQATGSSNYSIVILDLDSNARRSISLNPSNGKPTNLAWKSNDSLLITFESGGEPRILQLQLSGSNLDPFLPPWSANPTAVESGTMAYVVPVDNDYSNLGIVLSDAQGVASKYVTKTIFNEDLPSLSPDGSTISFSYRTIGDPNYRLGVIIRIQSSNPDDISSSFAITSTSPIRTYWTSKYTLLAAHCGLDSCNISLLSLLTRTAEPIYRANAAAIGNVVLRLG